MNNDDDDDDDDVYDDDDDFYDNDNDNDYNHDDDDDDDDDDVDDARQFMNKLRNDFKSAVLTPFSRTPSRAFLDVARSIKVNDRHLQTEKDNNH